MAGHGGGSWKVAYADFVTAMMAFFLVMWITAQNNAVKQAVAQYFQDPSSNSLKSTGGPPTMPPNKHGEIPGPSILPATSKPGSAIGVDHRLKWSTLNGSGEKKSSLFVLHNGDQRFMGTMILFAEGSTELDETAKEQLSQMVTELRGKSQKIEIRGHAARTPRSRENSGKDPWQMSYERCQAVMKFLVQHEIKPDRLRLSQGGAYEPYTLQADPALQTYNSRVEIYILDEYTENLMGTQEERTEHFNTP